MESGYIGPIGFIDDEPKSGFHGSARFATPDQSLSPLLSSSAAATPKREDDDSVGLFLDQDDTTAFADLFSLHSNTTTSNSSSSATSSPFDLTAPPSVDTEYSFDTGYLGLSQSAEVSPESSSLSPFDPFDGSQSESTSSSFDLDLPYSYPALDGGDTFLRQTGNVSEGGQKRQLNTVLRMPTTDTEAAHMQQQQISTQMVPQRTRSALKRASPYYSRPRECTVVCWLLRLLLSSEFNSLPLPSIFDAFQESNPSSASGRHWRQSIRHCLNSSAAFVRVLTPDPRKGYLVMNEAGSWWAVHPQWAAECAEAAFSESAPLHRCPPTSARNVRFRLVDERIVRLPAASSISERRQLRVERAFPALSVAAPSASSITAARAPSHSRPPYLTSSSLRRCRLPPSATAANEDFVIDHEEVV